MPLPNMMNITLLQIVCPSVVKEFRRLRGPHGLLGLSASQRLLLPRVPAPGPATGCQLGRPPECFDCGERPLDRVAIRSVGPLEGAGQLARELPRRLAERAALAP